MLKVNCKLPGVWWCSPGKAYKRTAVQQFILIKNLLCISTKIMFEVLSILRIY